MKNRVISLTAAAGVLAGASALFARRGYLRWGATAQEALEELPGDDLTPLAGLVATRAITVLAPAASVWPWIAQLGQGRGGLYSYDFLENLVGCDMHSADHIVAEWQNVAVGDELRLHPEVPLEVVAVEPGALSWCAAACPWARRRRPTSSRGPSWCASRPTTRPGCWCANATPTPAAGRPSLWNPSKR